MFPDTIMAGIPHEWVRLYHDLDSNLAAADKENENGIQIIRQRLTLCKEAVEALKKFIRTYAFRSVEEEVYFFKEVKPLFYSRLIYYLKLFDLETSRPPGDSRLLHTFFTKTANRLKRFWQTHVDFYQYCRSGETYLDTQYFTRGEPGTYFNLTDDYFNYDTSFSSARDITLAKLLATQRLFIYLSDCIREMQVKGSDNHLPAVKSSLQWTATKAGLIELLYALQSTGTFNEGSTDLKQIATYFEKAFNIQLGNYYNVFQEMRIRKKNRTHFLDQLKDRLIRRMDEADENFRG